MENEKKKINVLTVFFFYKRSVKIFLEWFINNYPKMGLAYLQYFLKMNLFLF